MQSIFEPLRSEWVQLDRAVHVYALPRMDPAVVAAYHRVIARTTSCRIQPPKWLHATVSRVPLFLQSDDDPNGDPARELIHRLSAKLDELTSRHRTFSVQLNRPEIWRVAVGCEGEPSAAWDAVVADVRGVIADVLPGDLPSGPFAPHVSLGYGVADGPDEQLVADIAEAASTIGWDQELVVDRLHLLAVDAVPDEGIFRWRTLSQHPLVT